ncbi:MAG: DinB family protein [Phycisphaerae bacterium]|nr:DinB family protein [Phycisphaerae bacterium]
MTQIEAFRQMLDTSRGMLLRMLDGIDGPALVYQPAGRRGNHALWLLGHIANSESHIVGWTGGAITVPPLADAKTRFGIGSIPVSDASQYPGKKQLLDYAAAVREQVLAALAKTDVAALDKPAVNAPPFLRSIGHAWQMAVIHEMMHVGQLTVVRKELCLPPIMG